MKYSDMQQQDAFSEYERIEAERNAPVAPTPQPPMIDYDAPLTFYKIDSTCSLSPELSTCGRFSISSAYVGGKPSYLAYRLTKPQPTLLSGCFSSIIDAYERCKQDLKNGT